MLSLGTWMMWGSLCGVLLGGTAQAADRGEYLRWNVKVGGEERFRYEYKQDFDFNRTTKDNGSPLYNRGRINARLALSDEYKNVLADVFAEGVDGQAGSYRLKVGSSQQDRFDFHQGYLGVYNLMGTPLDVKIGRQELVYGKGRIIAAPTWSNLVRAFDAAVVRVHQGLSSVDVLYGQVVKANPRAFDRSSDEEELAGIYGSYQKANTAPLVDAYFFDQIVSSGAPTVKRYTAGARLKLALPENVALDMELPYQFGSSGKSKISAYAFHADLSKTFGGVPWSPKLSIAYDEASGDKNPNDRRSNTFVPLYQTVHDPYGIMDFFRWQNVRNPEVGVTFSSTEKFRFTPQVDYFWLQSKYDAWYNSSGAVVRSKSSGSRGYFVGTETSLRFYYDFTKNIKAETGYAHFFPGGYVHNTGANDHADWLYTQLSIKY